MFAAAGFKFSCHSLTLFLLFSAKWSCLSGVVSSPSVLTNSLMSSTHRCVRLLIFVCAFIEIITPGFHSAALLVHLSSLCEEVLMAFLLCFPIQFPILNVCIFLLLLWCSS